jgi:hypothetical protein
LTWNNLATVTTETEFTTQKWNEMVRALNSIKFEVNNLNTQMDSMDITIETIA